MAIIDKMGKHINKASSTPEQIERIKVAVKGAMEKIYGDLMLDCSFRKVLALPNVGDMFSVLDKTYAKALVSLHANISDSLLCLCVLLLSDLRAQESIEKKFLLRRIVVVCHELYKYLYGFKKRQTDWELIAQKLENRYPEDCVYLQMQSDKYLKKYAQSEDKILRDVSNHYSDNPFEFFKYISTINEEGQMDRALMMLSIAQPLSMLLMKELDHMLPHTSSVESFPVNIECCQFKNVFNDTITERALHNMRHRKEIAWTHVQRIKKCEKFAEQYGYDIKRDDRWRLLKGDNIVLHVMYLQLDSMVLSLAMSRAESSLEEKIILAYMVASMHEGFKKIYGFKEEKHEKSLWYRYAISRQPFINDTSLSSDIRMVSVVLDAFAKQEYLRDTTVTLFLSHVGYVKDLEGDTSNAMANYLIKDDHRIELAGVIKILDFLNFLVEVSVKLLNYENELISDENRLKLEKHLNEIDEMERRALMKIRNDKDKMELKLQTSAIKDAVRKLYNWD